MDIEIFSTFCFMTIGQGPCVCLTKNCGTAHQGAIVKVKRGELLVSKNPTTVFGEPRIDASVLSDELMDVEGNGIHATQVSNQDTAVLLHYP
jgi:hypothetical protein